MDFREFERGYRVRRKEFKQREETLRVELLEAQAALLDAQHDVQVLIVGDDREACEEVVDLLHEWLDARVIHTEVFLERTQEEQQFPFLWRYWRALPRRGRLAVSLGHWVAEVLRAQLVDPSPERLTQRLGEVRAFERTLADAGSVLRKFWIHTPRKELAKRLKRKKRRKHGWRAAKPERQMFERYDELVELGERLVAETDVRHAPWIVVEGSNDEYRDLVIAEAVRDALRAGPFGPDPRPEAPEPVPFASRLAKIDLRASFGEHEYEKRLASAQARLSDLVFDAADRGIASVLAFEGQDAAGKGGAIRRITRPLAARDYRVVPISAPTDEERAHHYLWRFWRRLPRAGRMTIFDRSWYGRVLVERVEGFASEPEWRRAYGEIRDFERSLVDAGVLLRKFWLEIDRDEQLARFEARKDTPYKTFKITTEDYRNREEWDAYAVAVDEMLARTSTPAAPWTIVPANDKPYARVTVLEELCAAFERALR